MEQNGGEPIGGGPMLHHHDGAQPSGAGATGHAAARMTAMSPGQWIGMWMLMSGAMMIPAVIPAIRHLAFNSLRRRVRRSVAVFLIAYLGGWFLFGLVAFGVLYVLRGVLSNAAMLEAALALLVVWTFLPVQGRFRRLCHKSVPLPPRGWRADLGCAKFGISQTRACIGLCWPLMLVMALQLGAGAGWMIVLAAAVLIWKYIPRRYRVTLPSLSSWRLAHARTAAETMPTVQAVKIRSA